MSFVRGSLTALIAVLSSLLLSLCLILALLIWPFSRKIHYRTNCFLANTWGEFCVWWARVVCRIKIEEHGDAINQHENTIVIANHQCMADLITTLTFASRRGRIGDTKSFSKNSMKYWPGLGWALVLLDFIIVKRDWQKDATSVQRMYDRILRRGAPFWLVIFPEGTRITSEKLKRSQEYARQKNLSELQHVLLPRTKGFVSALESLHEKIDAVYDLTIDYGASVPSLWQVACGSPCHVVITVRRYPMSALPVHETEIKEWLYQRFVEKNKQLIASSTISCRW